MRTNILGKQEQLYALFRSWGRVAVAFSAGVDSTYLLYAAVQALGAENVLAAIGKSPSFPSRELTTAQELAEKIGAPYRIIACHEMDDPRYAANPRNRCYYCKSDLFTRIMDSAKQDGYAVVVDGNNADDLGDWRPGQQAARELGVHSPLIEVGMTKQEIRELSRIAGLPTWDKPASACLASRIPYSTPITETSLSAIDAAESFLREQGFRQVSVRHHNDVARIEVEPASIERFTDDALRKHIVTRLRELGYQYITLDLLGYRMGSMNEV